MWRRIGFEVQKEVELWVEDEREWVQIEFGVAATRLSFLGHKFDIINYDDGSKEPMI